ncbi:hypothetical protein [Amycolatopsis tucumanensis]|uniref:Uncharacterized protein n=1 Tax=Amycolatopsis tucumanensis TaxID=401106 RepID=A0ABP7JFJ6_9PSEU
MPTALGDAQRATPQPCGVRERGGTVTCAEPPSTPTALGDAQRAAPQSRGVRDGLNHPDAHGDPRQPSPEAISSLVREW